MQVSFEDGRPNAYSTQGPRRPNSYHCEPGGAGGLTFQYNPAPAGLITVSIFTICFGFLVPPALERLVQILTSI